MILYAPFSRRTPNLNGSGNPKDYPWPKELAELLLKNHEVIQLGGNEDEPLVPDFRKNLSFDEVGKLIRECDTGVCVDSYLQHHMWLLKKPAFVLWGISDPKIFGHYMHINLLKDRSFLRRNQFDLYYSNEHRPEAFYKPEEVINELAKHAI